MSKEVGGTTHADFWDHPNRLDQFRDDASKVIPELAGMSGAKLYRMTRHKFGTGMPTERGWLNHFGKKSTRPVSIRNPATLSYACIILADTIATSSLPETHGERGARIKTLADELRKVFGDELQSDLLDTGEDGECTVTDGDMLPITALRRFLEVVPAARKTNDPRFPEFPLNAPRFPATPAVETVEPIKQGEGKGTFRLFLKDESINPSACHKDRWALEMLLWYRARIEKLIKKHENSGAQGSQIKLPAMSMISSGGAAFALQSLLSHYNLPSLRVVMDESIGHGAEKLKAIGAKVYFRQLQGGIDDKDNADFYLSPEDVLEITENVGGYEITTRDEDEPFQKAFYDWLICEVLKLKPNYIFVPFGTGDLYGSFLAVLAKENGPGRRDKRLDGLRPEDLKGIHVLGATTEDQTSAMDKLYSAFQPTKKALRKKAKELIKSEIIGDKSGVYNLEDHWAVEARTEYESPKSPYFGATEPSGAAGLGLFRSKQGSLGLKDGDTVVVVNTGLYHIPY